MILLVVVVVVCRLGKEWIVVMVIVNINDIIVKRLIRMMLVVGGVGG